MFEKLWRVNQSRTFRHLQPFKLQHTKSSRSENLSAPALIILHGLLGSKHNWRRIALKLLLSTQLNIYACDLRNHGDSPHSHAMSYPHIAADVKKFMRNVGLHTATLMGMDVGARGVMTAALLYPEMVDHLICLGVSTEGPLDARVPPFLRTILQVDLKALKNLSRAEVINVFDKKFKDHDEHDLILKFVELELGTFKRGGYRWKVNIASIEKNFHKNLAYFQKPEGTTTFDKPTIFITGEDCVEAIKDEWKPVIRKTFPLAKFEAIPEAEFLVYWEKPDEVANIIKTFLSNS